MGKNLEVLQEDKNDCAAACISSLIKYYDGYMDLESIRLIINTTKEGTNAYDIINGVKEIGFESAGIKINFNALVNEDMPLVAHVKKDNYYHFVVIYKVIPERKKMLIMDPSIGLIKISYEKFNSMYLGTVLKLVKVKELPKLEKNNELLKVIISSSFKNKKTIIILSLLSLIVFILGVVSSLFYKVLIDDSTNILKYIYPFILIILIKLVLDFIRNLLMNNLNKNTELLLNKEMLNRLFRLPYSYYKNKTTGEIISRINDLSMIKDLTLDIVFNLFVDVLLVITSLILIGIISIKFLVISLIILILYLLISLIYNKLTNKRIRLLQESKGLYNHKLIESIEGLESISNLNLINNFINKVHSYFRDSCLENKKYNVCNIIITIFKEAILEISTLVILVLGIANMNETFTIGKVILVYMLYSNYVSAIKVFIDKLPDINYAYKNIEKVNGLLKKKNDAVNFKTINGDIKAVNLSFKRTKYLFKNISLEIKEGSKVILVGSSGCGKSSFLKILLKYFSSYAGNIFINDINLKDIDETIINNSFTYIGQNEKIFNDTIKNNILLGRRVNSELYETVINITRVNEIINSKGLRDNSIIEEDGFNLSGGERQRIILARSLIKNSNYLLIDEALSEVDDTLEKNIILDLIDKFRDKTIIYVSHKKNIQKLFKNKIFIERSNLND